MIDPSDKIALSLYVEQLNSFTEQGLDSKFDHAEYSTLSDYYRLLLHFETGGDFHREISQKRLEILHKLLAGEQSDLNMKRYKELQKQSPMLRPRMNLTDIEKNTATIVTDLFKAPYAQTTYMR